MLRIPVAGVYEIRNLVNNKVYVGSSVNVSRGRISAILRGESWA